MLNEQLPETYNKGLVFTHQKFLDACYSYGLSVMVGFPMPPKVFYTGETPTPATSWWTDNLTTTFTALGSHPAVMGFTIANEVDNGPVNTYENTAKTNTAAVQYFWNKIEAIAALAKAAAPDKLIGIANHDDPNICRKASSYMATCTSVDFWGVNTYQPASFASVFGDSATTGYATLTGAALKPVILTEYGFPSTSRKSADTLKPDKIYSDNTTEQNVADVLNVMLPKAHAEQLNLGVCYFEYCDEWWNQSGYSITNTTSTCSSATGSNAPTPSNGGSFTPPNLYTWYGGPVACGFPNFYWDNEGFGLYSVGVGKGRKDKNNPWDNAGNKPALPLDTRTPRQIVINAISKFLSMGVISGYVTNINPLANNEQQIEINSNAFGRPPAEGKEGSLDNYLYSPQNVTPMELTLLTNAKSNGKFVTVFFKSDNSRAIYAVIEGN